MNTEHPATDAAVLDLAGEGIGTELRWDQCLQAWFFFVFRMEGARRHRSPTMRVPLDRLDEAPRLLREAVQRIH